MSILRSLIKLEMQQARRNSVSWLEPLVFFAVCFTAFMFAGHKEAVDVFVNFFWIFSYLCAALHLPRQLQREAREGFLAQLSLLPMAREQWLATKILLQWVLITTPMLGFLAIMLRIYPDSGGNFSYTCIAYGTGMLGFTALSMLMGIAIMQLRDGSATAVIISAPIAIPIILFGIQATGGDFSALKLLLGMVLFLMPLCIIASEKLVSEV